MNTVDTERRVVVVGASLAGTRLVQGLRALGHTGPVTLIGAEAELPYDRPPLSKDLLTREWSDEAVAAVRLASAEELRDLHVDVRLGTAAVSLDTGAKTVALDDGAVVGYDVLVIATGAVARPSPWRPASGVHQLRTLGDARAIAERLARGGHLVVVGGGFIGTEIAAAARSRGCDVTIVDPLPEPMARLVGSEIAGTLVQLHARHGVRTLFGRGVVGIDGEEGALTVALDDGELLAADAVVVGIGSVPSTGWLEGSGILVDNGVVCDDRLRAAGAPDVYAIGDVARWPHPGHGVAVRAEHWTNASDQARYLAAALVQGDAGPYEPSDYVWSDQYDWKVHTVGRRDPEGRSTVVGDLAGNGQVAVIHADAAGVACGAVTVNWIRALNQVRRMLAAGATAETVVDELSAAPARARAGA
ncbi:NAD(P)/FAD-dependent oxidoreductase [Microbacterium sp. No. 7]|uniref:NAD(P)/FAD-dependent oxidoreductase n=1 Tax=Microbacterium sp. No. 7 TaxID=1714373 RepID=UPI0006D2038C|nr:FAD-dependent oxidoreductase [Microbacterium sp. No. 7]ALJ21955.1 hypothetical protein AOA12_19475 [Microbacterium sp. No. 7]